MNHTTTVLIAIAAIAATLLAAGTVTVASNHSAFAHKDYQKKYDKYSREDKSGRDGDNINVNKQIVKCIVVGRDDGTKRPDGPKAALTPTDEGGHAIGPNSCYADNENTNNDGVKSPPTPPTSTCDPAKIADQPATPTDGTCTAREDGASDSAFQAACKAAGGSTGDTHGANAICTFPSKSA